MLKLPIPLIDTNFLYRQAAKDLFGAKVNHPLFEQLQLRLKASSLPSGPLYAGRTTCHFSDNLYTVKTSTFTLLLPLTEEIHGYHSYVQ